MRYSTATKKGKGFLDKTLYSIPHELHIPGYNFCGPNTDLNKRRNQQGINELDNACKEHDLFYEQEKDLKRRHEADRILAQKALQRFRSRNASTGEKMAALGVAGAMKAKIKLGMSYSRKRSCRTVLNSCKRHLERTKVYIQSCLDKLNQFNTVSVVERKKVAKQKIPRTVKREEENVKKTDSEQSEKNIEAKEFEMINSSNTRKRKNSNIGVLDEDNVIPIKTLKIDKTLQHKPKKGINYESNLSRKRKLSFDGDSDNNGDDRDEGNLNKKAKN